jgi:small subunit ribosomal protein S9
MKAKRTDIIHLSGKRKRAIARATLTRNGSGIVKINNLLLDHFGSAMTRARILEPILLAGDTAAKVNLSVKVQGGGVTGQADAVRLAIARTLAAMDPALRSVFLDYDRQLLVADVRRKESAKPNSHGQARAKRQKSYR